MENEIEKCEIKGYRSKLNHKLTTADNLTVMKVKFGLYCSGVCCKKPNNTK